MSDSIRCVSPIDGTIYAERPIASEADIRRALQQARKAQVEWARLSVSDRARACSSVVDALLSQRKEIAPELTRQMGRPIRYCDGELGGFEERARYMISVAEESLRPLAIPPSDGVRRAIRREPLGLLFVIAPWNYPYLTAVNSIIPGLMAGNSVMLKHAPQTLLVGERFQAACNQAGLPEGLFTNLVLSHDQADKIIADGLVDRVNFTGSVATGRVIERAAAGTFVGVGLELGGKDPAYVRPDAELDFTVEQLVDGAYFNSGQSCCAVERIYVHESVLANFVDKFVQLTRGYVLGDPLDPDTTLGPMISASSADFVRGQVEQAVGAGARALLQPTEFPMDAAGSSYMAPQVVVDVSNDLSIMQDESFGPVVGVMSVASDDEAVRHMNDSRFGLTASIWTRDTDAALRIGDALEVGTVFQNRCDYLDPSLAWSGVKHSGRGATLSRVGYEFLTRPKSFYLRSSNPDSNL